MVSMMDILSGATPLMVDVRQIGSGPHPNQPILFDFPLDQVGACRVCRTTTVTADGEGAIYRVCFEGRS
jgi:hypothetical protein